MDFEMVSVILVFGILGILAYFDRKNIEFKYGVIIRRTQKGKENIVKFAKKYEKPLIKFANISIVLAIIASLVGFYFLLGFPGVRFIFPKIFPGKPSETAQRYAFFIPLWYWIIAIFIIIAPHELSHGLIAAIEKIPIRSLGVILFLIFPGAFVEPDEEKFQKSKPDTRMRIAAVGSIANLILFVLLMGVLLSLSFLGSAIFVPKGVAFENTIPDTPADEVNLEGVIIEINGEEIKDVNDLSTVLDGIEPGGEITVVTTKGVYEMKTIPNPENSSRSFIGVGNVSTKVEYNKNFMFLGNPSTGVDVYLWFVNLFNWVAFLDLNVAVANLLPFLPFDGGVIWQALFEKYFKKKRAKKMITVLSIITYGLLILNLVRIDRILRIFGF